MPRRPVFLLGLALVLGLTGCLAPPPRLHVETGHGTVRSDHRWTGHMVAGLLDSLVPEVQRRLPDTRPEKLEVWVQETLSVYRGWSVDSQVPAFTVEGDGRIHLLAGERIELSASLAHELVHAMLGPSWKTLPPVAEEGLADWMQEELNRQVAGSLRADHLAKAGAAVGGLEFGIWSRHRRGRRGSRLATLTFPAIEEGRKPIDLARALDDGDGNSGGFFRPYQVAVSDPRLYGLGYLVVSRILELEGVEALHALCVRAADEGREQVPGAWMLEASRLGTDAAVWRRIITRRIRYGELMALGRQLVPALIDLVVEDVGPRSDARSGREFLQEHDPVFGLVDGELRVDLESLPGFTEGLLEAWPDRRVSAGVTPDGSAVFWAAGTLSSPSAAPEAPAVATPARRPLP